MNPTAPAPPWLRLLGWLPWAAIVLAVALFAVEVPTQDDWDMPGALFEQWVQGQAKWAHFFAQQNESRFVLPRVIMLGLTLLLGMRTISWMCVSLALMGATLLALRRWGWDSRTAGAACLAGLGAALYCVPTQTENLTWGGQMGLFVPGLAIILCHAVTRRGGPAPRQYLLCGLLAFLATFSFANGMIVWVLGCPLWAALLRRERLGFGLPGLAYVLAAAVTIAWYFSDFHKVGTHPSMLEALGNPIRVVKYFLTWVGGPFGYALHHPLTQGPMLGTCLLGIAAWGVLGAWRHRADLPPVTHLWLAMLAYALACGALTSLGRSSLGQETALATRYVTFALWVPLSSLGLLAATRSALLPHFASGLAVLLLLAWPSGWIELRQRRDRLEQDRLTLRLVDWAPENPLLARLHPDRTPTVTKTHLFANYGWLPPLPDWSWLRAATEQQPGAPGGWVDAAPRQAGGFLGWASNPTTRQAADFVIIVERTAGGWKPFSAVRVDRARRDVAKSWNAPGLAYCGFETHFPAWPKGEWRAFAVDERARAIFPLEVRP